MNHYDRPADEEKLAQEYFYNIIQNQRHTPPQELSAETADAINLLVRSEQEHTSAAQNQFEAAQQRIWQHIQARTGTANAAGADTNSWPGMLTESTRPDQPAADSPRWASGPARPVKFNPVRIAALAGMAATIVLLAGIIGLALGGLKPLDEAGRTPGAGQVGAVPAKMPSPSPVPTTLEPAQATADFSSPKYLLSAAITDIARLLDISPPDLLKRLQSGQTLSTIAAEQGVDSMKIKTVLETSFKQQVAAGIQAGKLTQAQADLVTKQYGPFIEELMSMNTASIQAVLAKLLSTILQEVAPVLNLSPGDLQARLKAGQSLAEIARGQGVEPAKLKQALLDSLKPRLAAAVDSGLLNQTQADQALDDSTGALDGLINGNTGKFPGN